jgi:hypothetical protein
MDPISYSRRFIYFWQASPISGAFDETKYPLIIKPLMALDNMVCKVQTIYGPTQSLKSVLLQISIAYFLDITRKSVLAAAQTDDDAKEFSQIKLRPFLERIETLTSTVKKNRHAITDDHWLWPTHELIISGPGENAQQSKSVCYVCTDEAHRYNLEYPGAMAALNDRMGERWDRKALHVTTAAKAGTEVDILYHRGRQNEWHQRCIHCNLLFRPLWEDHSKEVYNGHKVFQWIDSQSENETLSSIKCYCPHCDLEIKDTPQNRAAMDEGADYIPANPDASPMFDSYRWNAFALRWKARPDLLAIYLSAIHSAKLGDLSKYTNWITKQEVRTDMDEFPMLGGSSVGRDYKKSDVEIVDENNVRTCSIDRQQGKDGKGFHLWALIEEWERNGNSRRVEYKELESWTAANEYREYYHAKPAHTGADYGNQTGRDVFGACALYRWFALKSGDEIEFPHRILNRDKSVSIVNYPFSETRMEDSMTGKAIDRKTRNRPGHVPAHCCLSMLWSKPVIYPILYALKNGESGRYYGVASDFNPVFVDQLHSYIPGLDIDKKTNVTRKQIWQKIKKDDHSFVCSAQGVVLAMRAGYFPMSLPEPQKTEVISE